MSRSLPSCGSASPGRNDRIGSLFLNRRKNKEIRTISKQSQWEGSGQKLALCSQFCLQLGVGKHKSHTLFYIGHCDRLHFLGSSLYVEIAV